MEFLVIIAEEINKNYPLIGAVILAAALSALVTKFVVRTNHTNSAFPKIERMLRRINMGLMTLNNVLLEREIIKQSCYSGTDSPRTVNSLGEKLFKESGAGLLFETLKPDFMNALREKQFNSLLELERQCLNVLMEARDRPEFKRVQNFAFEYPIFQGSPLTYSDILFVMALKLRDVYRKAYSEKNLA